jgi:nucleoside-diphosphate-sugar epimerase
MGVYTDILIELSGLKNVNKVISDKLYRPIDIHYQHGDCTELVDITGWKAQYDLKTTLQDLLNYWLNKIG